MNPMNMMQMVQMLRQNPMQILQQRGINIPQNISNNPQEIIQYLLNNGKVSQQQLNQVMQMMNQYR